jgi:hypothetical protein
MASITEFKNRLTGGGVRPNQFRVFLTFPLWIGPGLLAARDAQFLCKGATLPGGTIGNTPVQFRGRQVNLAGERTFAPWSTTILADSNFNIRNALEFWQNGINSTSSNRGFINPSSYMADIIVQQLDRNDSVLKTYLLRDSYPTNLGEMALDFGTNDQVAEFTCEFTYQSFEAIGGLGGITTLDIAGLATGGGLI